jgi:protein-disulfide isomerase/uncharacterized membrane protein
MNASDKPTVLPRALHVIAGLCAVGAAIAQVTAVEVAPLILFLIGFAFFAAGAIAHAPRTGTLITAIGAFSANAYLFSRKMAMGAGDAACNISEVINCDAVNSSPYSEAFGVPITLIGMAFYAGLAAASLFAPKKTPRFHQLNALFAIVSLVYSLFLGAVSAQMGHVCVVCLSLYADNALLLWAGLRGMSSSGTRLTDDLGGLATSRSFMTITAGFAIVLLVGGSAWRGRPAAMPTGSGDTLSAETLGAMYTLPAADVRLDGSEPILGDKNAPYLLVEFADYACPHCARAERELHALVEELPQLQVRFKPFPLTSQCNPQLQFDGGSERCIAAFGTECARQQGRFWEYSASVFRNQQYMSTEDLTFQAEQVGLDVAQWKDCIERPDTRQGVLADAQAGQDAGVNGTPTMFLKGTHGERWIMITQGPAAAKKLIEAHAAGVVLPEPGPYGAGM